MAFSSRSDGESVYAATAQDRLPTIAIVKPRWLTRRRHRSIIAEPQALGDLVQGWPQGIPLIRLDEAEVEGDSVAVVRDEEHVLHSGRHRPGGVVDSDPRGGDAI